jgi:hypothetical protein
MAALRTENLFAGNVMGLKTLLYVSKSLIAPTDTAREVERIVTVARARNAELGVSGVLISTEARFAQVLEGPRAAVDLLMESILVDPRHEQVTISRDEAVRQRRFPHWSLAYCGASLYVDRHVRPLLEPALQGPDQRRNCDRLLLLMEELARVNA